MDDKTILELCAKAMGLDKKLEKHGISNNEGGWVSYVKSTEYRSGRASYTYWDPLYDASDYEQMEAELELNTD